MTPGRIVRPLSVDLLAAPARRQLAECRNPPLTHADIERLHPIGRRNSPIPENEVKWLVHADHPFC